MLITKRMQDRGLLPLGFNANDYCLAVWSQKPVDDPAPLLSPDILTDEFVEWVQNSHLLRRAFREVAVISGLIERTSEMLRDNSVTIQQQAASSTVSVESLQKAFANVYQTMDSIDSFKIEALNNMSQTIGTLETEVAKSRAYLERARQSDSRRGLAEGITSTPNYDLR